MIPIDLVQKSVPGQFTVAKRSGQVEAQRKSRSAIAIPLTKDAKGLQLSKNMPNHDPLGSQRTIFLLFLFCQRIIFGFLDRGLAVFIRFCQVLVTSIRQGLYVFRNLEFLIEEKLKVMLATLAKSGGYNFSGFLIGDQLCFLGMSLLFAAVVRFLAFLDAQRVVH
jgi:hypothetical protein